MVSLHPKKSENLLSDSQKLLEFDSLNALLNEGTNHYNKKPFVPLAKKNSLSKTRNRVPTQEAEKLFIKNKKNGRDFELRNNVIVVDLIGETIIGNHSCENQEDANLLTKGTLIINHRKIVFSVRFGII